MTSNGQIIRMAAWKAACIRCAGLPTTVKFAHVKVFQREIEEDVNSCSR